MSVSEYSLYVARSSVLNAPNETAPSMRVFAGHVRPRIRTASELIAPTCVISQAGSAPRFLFTVYSVIGIDCITPGINSPARVTIGLPFQSKNVGCSINELLPEISASRLSGFGFC